MRKRFIARLSPPLSLTGCPPCVTFGLRLRPVTGRQAIGQAAYGEAEPVVDEAAALAREHRRSR